MYYTDQVGYRPAALYKILNTNEIQAAELTIDTSNHRPIDLVNTAHWYRHRRTQT